jgi:hypothetical protein
LVIDEMTTPSARRQWALRRRRRDGRDREEGL